MKTSKRDETENERKPWRTESVGSVSVAIYHRSKLHKASGKNYPVYEVTDYSTGKRILRSFSKPRRAIDEAQRLARLISTGQATAATMTNSEAASYGRAIELLRGLDVPLELAAAHFAEAFKILGGDKIIEAAREYVRRNPTERPERTIPEVTAELVDLKKRRKAGSRYIEDLEGRLATFAKSFVNIRVDRISTTDIQRWLDGLDAAPRTVKNFRSAASSMFKHCEARGYIGRGDNPVTATDKVTTKTSDPITLYSPEELTRLIDAASDAFKPVILLQAFAGLRSAEVMRLDWADVKLDRGHIEVSAAKAKTASRRLVPITPNLSQWLATFKNRKGKVFPHSRAYFHESQRDTATKTATKDEPEAIEWRHNALRHSFISYRIATVKNVAQVALEAGNSPAMIFAHYRELVEAKAGKAWFAIAPQKPANVVTLKQKAA